MKICWMSSCQAEQPKAKANANATAKACKILNWLLQRRGRATHCSHAAEAKRGQRVRAGFFEVSSSVSQHEFYQPLAPCPVPLAPRQWLRLCLMRSVLLYIIVYDGNIKLARVVAARRLSSLPLRCAWPRTANDSLRFRDYIVMGALILWLWFGWASTFMPHLALGLRRGHKINALRWIAQRREREWVRQRERDRGGIWGNRRAALLSLHNGNS